MADKSVSVPERAREIAGSLWASIKQSRIANGYHSAAEEATVLFALEAAMWSERELCIKELRTALVGEDEHNSWERAAKLLREGGK